MDFSPPDPGITAKAHSLLPLSIDTHQKDFKQDLETGLRQRDDDYNRLMSLPDMGIDQTDGLESLQENRYVNGRGQSMNGSESIAIGSFQMPGLPSAAEVALSAMQYLPYPLIVLNGLKTVVMANDAMSRLLGLDDQDDDITSEDVVSPVDRLYGQSLTQLGIDLLLDGRPVWVTWDSLYGSPFSLH